MNKVSDKGASHHPGRFAVRWRRYYDQIHRGPNDQHPVDEAVEKCLGNVTTRAKIVRLQERVSAAMGADASTFLELESLQTETQREREKCFFDLGYEHGSVEAQAKAKLGSVGLSRESEAFGREVRTRIVNANLPASEAIVVLLECVWRMADGQRR
jgi:hypothetical protein